MYVTYFNRVHLALPSPVLIHKRKFVLLAVSGGTLLYRLALLFNDLQQLRIRDNLRLLWMFTLRRARPTPAREPVEGLSLL